MPDDDAERAMLAAAALYAAALFTRHYAYRMPRAMPLSRLYARCPLCVRARRLCRAVYALQPRAPRVLRAMILSERAQRRCHIGVIVTWRITPRHCFMTVTTDICYIYADAAFFH